MIEKLLTWDRETFIYLNSLGIEEYDYFWSFATNLSTWVPLYIFIIFLFFYKQNYKEAFLKLTTVVLMLLFVLVVTMLSKEWIGRLRPSADPTLNKLIRVIKTSPEFSFVSGHASFSFSLATLTVLFLKQKFKWIWVLYIWPIFLSLSRIYVGVHYPLDLMMGALLGVLSADLFKGFYNKFIARDSKSSHL